MTSERHGEDIEEPAVAEVSRSYFEAFLEAGEGVFGGRPDGVQTAALQREDAAMLVVLADAVLHLGQSEMAGGVMAEDHGQFPAHGRDPAHLVEDFARDIDGLLVLPQTEEHDGVVILGDHALVVAEIGILKARGHLPQFPLPPDGVPAFPHQAGDLGKLLLQRVPFGGGMGEFRHFPGDGGVRIPRRGAQEKEPQRDGGKNERGREGQPLAGIRFRRRHLYVAGRLIEPVSGRKSFSFQRRPRIHQPPHRLITHPRCLQIRSSP